MMESNMWNSVTMRELLDRLEQPKGALKPEATAAHLKAKLEDEEPSSAAPESAFLGPKLWQKPISFQEFNEDDFFVMNIEDFLTENDMDKQKLDRAMKCDDMSPEPDEMRCTSLASLSLKSPIGSPDQSSSSSVISAEHTPSPRPGVIVSTKKEANPDIQQQLGREVNSFLYAESKRARLEREKLEKKRKLEEEIEFAPEDLALATVPGADFDPKRRAFDVEELKPQPIIRKRPKILVPDLQKDDKYWEKRCKNNFAARRSREARRLKENQIALRAAFLERENNMLKRDLEDTKFENNKLAMERDILKKKLEKYEGSNHSLS
eukprot:TRINITY_DN6254_c0_g1_i2.p1 TRINITY_DN6254_c0_g1~~TRINITY_DN6254_c0_g1_i2.p1  ORF type:complete len:322 (-),score=134.65 TRINITY_DN6254_c0_g1_i2:588-1553(-)